MSSITTLLYSFLVVIILWAGACRTAMQKSRPFLDDAARYTDDLTRGADDAAKLADDVAIIGKARRSLMWKALNHTWVDIVQEVAKKSGDDGLDVLARVDLDPSDQVVIRKSQTTLSSHLLRIPRHVALAKDENGNTTWKPLYLDQESPALMDAMLCMNLFH